MDLPREHGLIWQAIYPHLGEKNAANARVILAEAGLCMSGGRLRDIVHELRTVYHRLAGSNPKGYFRIETRREAASQRRRMRRRAIRIMRAAKGIETAWFKHDQARREPRLGGEQERITFGEGPVAQPLERRAKPSPRVARRPRLETARAQSGGS